MYRPRKARRFNPYTAIAAVAFAVYGAASGSLLPYLASNLEYLTALESGVFHPRTIVHVLWMPTLSMLREAFTLFGYDGSMLVPIGAFNILISIGALWVLYRLGRKATGDSWTSLVITLLFGVSPGFWQACLRVDPYALAILFAAMSFYLLILKPIPAPILYPALGMTTALSLGYHLASIALIPIIVITALLEEEPLKERLEHIFVYITILSLSTAAGYALWTAYYWPAPRLQLANGSLRELFSVAESLPGTSIYSSGSVLRQLRGMGQTVRYQVGALAGLATVAAIFASPHFAENWQRQRRNISIIALYIFFYGAFYLINNTQNGFIFATGAAFPLLFSLSLAPFRPFLKILPLTAAACAIFFSIQSMRESKHQGTLSPFYQEAVFLDTQTHNGDLFLVPGCPFDDLHSLALLHTLRVGKDFAADRKDCAAPFVPLGPSLQERIDYHLEKNQRVFLMEGETRTPFNPLDPGPQKMLQLFQSSEPSAQDRLTRLADIKDFLSRHYDWGEELQSPQGRRYLGLAAKKNSRLRKNNKMPRTEKPRPLTKIPSHLRLREFYLRSVHEKDPADPYASADLNSFYAELVVRAEEKTLSHPDDPETLARRYGKGLDFPNSIRAAKKIENADKRARTLLFIARAAHAAKRNTPAHEALTLAANINGLTPIRLQELTQTSIRLGALKRARRAFELAGENAPTHSGFWIERARNALSLHNQEASLAALKKARSYNPSSEEIRRMARIYGDLGKNKDGLALLSALLRSHPKDLQLHLEHARQSRAAGRTQQATLSLSAAYAYSQTDQEKRQIAHFYQEWGNIERALEILRALSPTGKEKALTLKDIGVCEFMRGNKDAAADALEKAIRLAPDLSSAYLSLSTVYSALGRPEDSRRLFARGKELEAKEPLRR